MEKWIMPDWMEPYKDIITNTGGNSIGELMNDDGKNSNLFNNAPRGRCYALPLKAKSHYWKSYTNRD